MGTPVPFHGWVLFSYDGDRYGLYVLYAPSTCFDSEWVEGMMTDYAANAFFSRLKSRLLGRVSKLYFSKLKG